MQRGLGRALEVENVNSVAHGGEVAEGDQYVRRFGRSALKLCVVSNPGC